MELFAGGFELAGDDRGLFGLRAQRGIAAGRGFEFARQPPGTFEPIGAEAGQQRAQTLGEVEGQASCLALAAGELPGTGGGTAERGAGTFSPRRGAAEPGSEQCGALPRAGRALSQQAAAGGGLREPNPEAPDRGRGATQARAKPRRLGRAALTGRVEAPQARQSVGRASERGEADHGPHTRFGGNAALPA